jgi:major inositol transporter-like SP family MFS transporter
LWVGMLFLPDTPRWYASMGRYGEALKVLRQVRRAEEAEPELERIEQNIEVERDLPKATWGDLAIPWVRHLVFVGIGIAICQQITGVNTIMYYAPTILQKAGLSTQNALTASIANGVISVLATFFGIWQVGRTGRRRMLISGQCGITISLFLIAVVFFTTPHGPGGQLVFGPAQSYLVLLFMLTFLCFQQGQISPVTWLMLSEIFPLRLRGFAVGLAVFIVWLVNFLISFSFPILLNALGGAWTFAGFALVNVMMILFSTKFVPETKGMSLEELEDHFRHYEFTSSLPRGGRSGQ